ncbi:MAG: UvrB/UvrC motif-containing protein [Clostridia bacterium]|nr:UvrB/UvrC motif-containing protein [Clostridia bacterium]
MMCEECGMNPAVFHFVTIKNDERSEKNLCPACMAKYKKQLPGIDIKNLAGILNNLIEGKPGSRKEQIDPETAAITCEQCGMTYGEFKKCGMLGCAECYHAFHEPMTALLQRIHGNTQHAGRIPGGVHSGTSIRMNIDRLKQQLQKAVAAEEYEQAAKLRDAIRALTAQLEQREKSIHVGPPERIEAGSEGGDLNA